MFVSKEQERTKGGERQVAIGWLGRQLAWEHVLNRLRVAAGVAPPGSSAATPAAGDDASRSAA
jgi:hypothetical protein